MISRRNPQSHCDRFLGAFEKLWNTTGSFVMSVPLYLFAHPSVRVEQHGSHWTDFHEILYLCIFENVQTKFKIHYNATSIRVLYMKTYVHLWSYLALFFLEWEMFSADFVEKIKTHFIFNNGFRKSRHSWDNVEKYSRTGQATDDKMEHGIAC